MSDFHNIDSFWTETYILVRVTKDFITYLFMLAYALNKNGTKTSSGCIQEFNLLVNFDFTMYFIMIFISTYLSNGWWSRQETGCSNMCGLLCLIQSTLNYSSECNYCIQENIRPV